MSTASTAPRRAPVFIALLGLPLIALASCGKGQSDGGASVGAGTVLSAVTDEGTPITLRVDTVDVDPNDPDGDVFLYEMSYLDQVDQTYKPYCLPNARGQRYAIPLSGSWDASRNHHPDAEVITFGCASGALAKCVRLGYKPWKTVSGVSLADYHQACLHMLPADYCGDGRAHTREGTLIDIWDRLGIQTRAPAPDLVLEAAWGPRGAVHVNKARYGETLQSLVAECPDQLRGRTALEAPGLDQEGIVARWPEALLFNESRVTSELP